MRKSRVAFFPVRFVLMIRGDAAIKVFLFFDMSVVVKLFGGEKLIFSLYSESCIGRPTISRVSTVPNFSVCLLHGQIENWRSSMGNVVVIWDK